MMSRGVRRAVVLAAFAALAAGLAAADRYDALVPDKPARYVTDRAGVLPPGAPEALNARLEQFERDTSNQILVWIDKKVPEGFTLEDFTVRAAQKWGAGQKQTDNGAVLFVFSEDRKVRIEVGYGLEGALPDVTAKRIIEDEIVPHFRSGDYAGGIEAGAAAMMAAAKGEYKGTGRTRGDSRRRVDVPGTCVGLAIFFFFFVILPMLMRRNRGFRSHGGGGWWTGGGFGGGGGWGGGSSGGGFSGGGFSGGGGSFGGGGASGSW